MTGLVEQPVASGQPPALARSRGDTARRWLWGLVALLAVAVLVTLGLRAWPLLHAPVSAWAVPEPACDPRAGPCTARFADGGMVTLDLLPRGIPSVTPLAASATLHGLLPPLRVELDLVGADMNMGYNRVSLTPTGEPDRYTGGAMLPVCVRERMLWEARVLLHYPDRLLAAPFRFVAERR